MSKIPYRIYLSEEEIPHQWYNIRADMKEQHDPYISPATMKNAKLEELYPVFCEEPYPCRKGTPRLILRKCRGG